MTGLDSHTMPDPVPDEHFDPWNFRTDVAVEVRGAKLAGHQVEAIDGKVGTVTVGHLEPGDSYLVVSTGRLLGKKLQLPAGIVNHIDRDARMVYVDRTKNQIKGAPEVPPEGYDEPAQRQSLASYYERTYQG